MQRNEVKTTLALILNAFQNFQITPQVVDLWLTILGHRPFELVKKATLAYLSGDSSFAPTPGQINTLCAKLCQPEQERLTAGEAWEMAVTAAKSSLSLKELQLQYANFPRLISAARQVGWERVRYGNLETEMDFIRQAFIRFYDEMQERDEDRLMLDGGSLENLPAPILKALTGGGK